MPIEYELDTESQLLLISYLGPITREEIVEHRAALENDARDVLRYSTIVDLRYGSIAMSPEEIRDLARAARDRPWPPSRCAFVAPHERLFGDMRMFEQWAESGPRQYRTFRTLRDACGWLGVTACQWCDEDEEAPS